MFAEMPFATLPFAWIPEAEAAAPAVVSEAAAAVDITDAEVISGFVPAGGDGGSDLLVKPPSYSWAEWNRLRRKIAEAKGPRGEPLEEEGDSGPDLTEAKEPDKPPVLRSGTSDLNFGLETLLPQLLVPPELPQVERKARAPLPTEPPPPAVEDFSSRFIVLPPAVAKLPEPNEDDDEEAMMLLLMLMDDGIV